MAVGITATVQANTPPRVLVSVTGLTIGDSLVIWRVAGGERTLMRAGWVEGVADTSYLRTDAELPFGQPLTYVVLVNGSTEYTSNTVTVNVADGKPVLSDAISGNAISVTIMSAPEPDRQRQASVFQVGGRNVVVSGEMGMYSGELVVKTDTAADREAMMALVANATEGVVQLRQPGGYDVDDGYLAVLASSQRRVSPRSGTDPRRLFSLSVVEVEGWAPALETTGTTLQDIADNYDVATIRDAYTFAIDTEGWTTPTAGAAVARVATPSEDADGSLRLTPPGAVAAPEARAPGTGSVMSGSGSYTVTARVQTSVAWATGVQVVIRWYDGSSVFLSESAGTAVGLAAATWATASVTANAPATALRAQAVLRFSGTPANTVLLYADDVTVQRDRFTLADIYSDYPTLLQLAQATF